MEMPMRVQERKVMAINYVGNDTYGYGFCRKCNNQCNYQRDGYCQRCWDSPISTQTINIDHQIELSERRTAELLAKKELMDQFGSDEDYDVDDAILFKRKFNGSRKVYTYVAVKTPAAWYITGTKCYGGISFNTLVEEYLIKAEEVWNCTEWTQVV